MRRRTAARPPRRSRNGPGRRPDRALSVSREDLRAILNALPAMVGYWDADLRNHMANDAYVDYFGLTPRQIHGRHIRDVLGPELFEQNHPYMQRALAGEPQLFDRTIVDPDGVARHTQASYVPDVVDGEVRGFFVLVTDITARRDAEHALAAAESRSRALFESAPIGMFLTDLQGRYLDVNPAGARLLGMRREELVGRSIDDVTHPDDRPVGIEELARLRRGELEAFRVEKRYVHRDGHVVWAQVDVTALHDDPDGAVTLAQVQDISERRRHEDQLRHLAEHDPLTGLRNRRGLMEEIERRAATAARYGSAGALLVLDLDGFKQVNDTFGHQAGDALVVAVADALRRRVRRTDVVGRLGGDEFAVVVPHGGMEEARRLGEGLLAVVQARTAGSGVRVSASIGAATFDQGRSGGEVLAVADLAMYRAKAAGGDRVALELEPA
ncbi:MAG TPA: PAS domain S-box protein [Baekduia sp.]|nr:PAS domain S-box protein [Baekduia sp.]